MEAYEKVDLPCREKISARLTGFLHAGEATSPLEPRRRRHLNRVLGFRLRYTQVGMRPSSSHLKEYRTHPFCMLHDHIG